MKPRIGRKVYCLYGSGILVDKVGFLGKISFIISSFGSDTEPDSWEWDYDDYGVQWFASLKKATEALLERYKDRCDGKLKVVKVSSSWYQLEEV